MLVEYVKCRPGQLESAIKEFPLALVPIGSLEWHGPHMPLGFDGMKAEYLLRKVGATIGNGVIFPTIYFGAYDVMNFPYTYKFPRRYLQDQITRFTEQLVGSGFKVLVMLTGHYPRTQVAFLEKLAIAIMKKQPDICMLAVPEYYLTTRSKQMGDHAAMMETSLGLSMFPEWIDLDQRVGPARSREDLRALGIGGEDPKVFATREKGNAWTIEIVDAVVKGIQRASSEKSQAAFKEIYTEFHQLEAELKRSREREKQAHR